MSVVPEARQASTVPEARQASTVPEARQASTVPAYLEHARKVADAVMYEGYLLYPYHQSASKNQSRFQFGVLMPPAYRDIDAGEPPGNQTECLVECGDDAQVHVQVRFLHQRHRRAYGVEHTAWAEAVQREWRVSARAGDLIAADTVARRHVAAGQEREDLHDCAGRPAGGLVRAWQALDGQVTLHAERVAWPYGALKLRVLVENQTAPRIALRARTDALAYALIGTHALIWVAGGRFLSMTDPPEWAAQEVAGCVNVGTWPVLAGPPDCHDLVLSAPVILYDHAEVAPESTGDSFDATEIDELLTLCTLTLTEAEKRAARATDPRIAALMDRIDAMPGEALGRLHGAMRFQGSGPAGSGPARIDRIEIDGVPVSRGSRILMRPGVRRADAQDLFLAGRVARVEAVLRDADGNVHVAVTPEDDPVADLHAGHGRFRYFAPDEIEPLAGLRGQANAGTDEHDAGEALKQPRDGWPAQQGDAACGQPRQDGQPSARPAERPNTNRSH